MEKNQINFTDENGQLIPLEEIQKAIEEIYNEAKEHIEIMKIMKIMKITVTEVY